MKVSIKKAAAFQAAIFEQLNGYPLVAEVSVNEFQRPSDIVNTAFSKFVDDLVVIDNYINVAYSIRAKISKANMESGVDTILNALAKNEKISGFFKRYSSFKECIPQDVIIGMIGKIKSADNSTSAYYDSEMFKTVKTSVFSAEFLESMKTELKKLQKEKMLLQEELLKKNMTVEIDLDEQEVKVLTDLNLI